MELHAVDALRCVKTAPLRSVLKSQFEKKIAPPDCHHNACTKLVKLGMRRGVWWGVWLFVFAHRYCTPRAHSIMHVNACIGYIKNVIRN